MWRWSINAMNVKLWLYYQSYINYNILDNVTYYISHYIFIYHNYIMIFNIVISGPPTLNLKSRTHLAEDGFDFTFSLGLGPSGLPPSPSAQQGSCASYSSWICPHLGLQFWHFHSCFPFLFVSLNLGQLLVSLAKVPANSKSVRLQLQTSQM